MVNAGQDLPVNRTQTIAFHFLWFGTEIPPLEGRLGRKPSLPCQLRVREWPGRPEKA